MKIGIGVGMIRTVAANLIVFNPWAQEYDAIRPLKVSPSLKGLNLSTFVGSTPHT